MSGVPIQPEGWLKPRGYSNGMRARGEVVAVGGQIGWNARCELVGDGFVEQFEQALANVVAVVAAAGGGAADIVSLTIYVTDRREYLQALGPLGDAYRRVMGKHYPAMALVMVAGLVEPHAKVEIQGLAVLP
jgi:enamine deaminase RidA (YjgF/YER057c/UK114 family)